MEKKYKRGLVLGKMYPVHLGHLHLIDTAIQNCEHVDVMLCHNKSQWIPGNFRVNCLKEIYIGNLNVTIHEFEDDNLPQTEQESNSLDEFYSHWVEAVHKTIGNNLDVVLTSEKYGDDFARYLGIEHCLVDIDRTTFPVSGTKIRENPMQYWDLMPRQTQNFFVRRIAILGPESTGKSVLTKSLAQHFNTDFVEEYGRTLYEEQNGNLDLYDFKLISQRRQELEDKAVRIANKLLFCDTEDITTMIFSKMYHPHNYYFLNYFFQGVLSAKPYDLYILLRPDCDEVQDGTRLFLNDRWNHYSIIRECLCRKGVNFVEVGGSWENRLRESILESERVLNC